MAGSNQEGGKSKTTGAKASPHSGALAHQGLRRVDALALQKRDALQRFYAAVRKATPQVRALAERYGGDVSFCFDRNGQSVWVMALFGKGAPPTLRTVSDREVPWIPLDDEQEEDRNEEDED